MLKLIIYKITQRLQKILGQTLTLDIFEKKSEANENEHRSTTIGEKVFTYQIGLKHADLLENVLGRFQKPTCVEQMSDQFSEVWDLRSTNLYLFVIQAVRFPLLVLEMLQRLPFVLQSGERA